MRYLLVTISFYGSRVERLISEKMALEFIKNLATPTYVQLIEVAE